MGYGAAIRSLFLKAKELDLDSLVTLDLIIVNNQIFLFSSKGYLLSFNYKNGKIDFAERILKSGIGSSPVFVNGNMYLLDKSNRLFKYK